MDKIEFQANKPVEMRLAFPTGKEVESRFGGATQVMYTTMDGRCFFVSMGASGVIYEQLQQLGVKPGEPIALTKAETKNGTRKTTQWQVTRAFADGEQRDGTFAFKAPGAAAQTAAPVRAASQPHDATNGNGTRPNGNGHQPPPDASRQPAHAHLPWALHLLNVSNALTDVYAAALAYASQRHGNSVKPEDVRNLVTTAYISVTKNGGPHAA